MFICISIRDHPPNYTYGRIDGGEGCQLAIVAGADVIEHSIVVTHIKNRIACQIY